jgi:acetyl-CoA carboxylase carboxyl transferase subunit alpha
MENSNESMPLQFLEFEEPIKALYEQIEQLKSMEAKSKLPMDDKIKEIEQKIEETKVEITQNLTTWQKVQLSRHPNRPYSIFYVNQIADEFIELHGDRNVKDDKAIVCYMAKIDGKSVMIVGHQKGINTKMRQYRNFGMPNPEGYRKALRMMKMAEKFNIPVVTLIDTPGAFPGIEAEDRGQAEAIARNLYEMAQLTVPILCYVIGEGASGGALGIGVGDKTFMLQNTWFTVISPESCSSILWRSWEHKEKAAEALKLTSTDMKQLKLVDDVIKEPASGAHREQQEMFLTVKNSIQKYLKELEAIAPEKRINDRIEKFCTMGVWQ